MTKNIAYLSFESPEDSSGVGRKISLQIKEWKKNGYNVEHICLKRNNKFKHYSKNPTLNLFLNLKNLKEQLTEYNPDIIYMREVLYIPFLNNPLSIAPYVVEINSNAQNEYYSSSKIKYFYYKTFNSCLIKSAKGLVFVSNELQKSLNKHSKKHSVIANGYDFKNTKTVEANNNNRVNFIFVGNPNQSWSGFEELEKFASAMPDCHFRVIGGDFKTNLPNIEVFSFINKEDLVPLYQKSDIALGTLALFKKNMEEASPLKAREYLAYGLPSILPFHDTDLNDLTAKDGVLSIPNKENSLLENKEKIIGFCKQWKGKRVPHKTTKPYLCNIEKEKRRLQFFEEILSK